MSIGQRRATLHDLYNEPGRDELVGGAIVRFSPMGHKPGRVTGRIARSLADFANDVGQGEAYTSTIVFAVPELSSGRESFSPYASFYDGKLPEDPMRFIEGAPTFAVEVRSENDDETEMADKLIISSPAPRWFGTSTRSWSASTCIGTGIRLSR
jgi:Uma2 family endonuclease